MCLQGHVDDNLDVAIKKLNCEWMRKSKHVY
jgi:hypothetical protein